jgi:hypothetical protein
MKQAPEVIPCTPLTILRTKSNTSGKAGGLKTVNRSKRADSLSTQGCARTYMGRRKHFTGQSFWARGYYVSTVGRDEETDYGLNYFLVSSFFPYLLNFRRFTDKENLDDSRNCQTGNVNII